MTSCPPWTNSRCSPGKHLSPEQWDPGGRGWARWDPAVAGGSPGPRGGWWGPEILPVPHSALPQTWLRGPGPSQERCGGWEHAVSRVAGLSAHEVAQVPPDPIRSLWGEQLPPGREATVPAWLSRATMQVSRAGDAGFPRGPSQASRASPVVYMVKNLPTLWEAEIKQNAGLDEAQAGIKITGRNNLTHSDITTLLAESKDELKSLLMKVKEESEKPGLKLNSQKTKIVASGPITS